MAYSDTIRSQTILAKITNAFSIRQYYLEFKEKWFHIIFAGSLDALTTIIAMSVFSMFELNPLVNHLFPDYVIFIPFVLTELAFIRYSIVRRLFQKPKHLTFAIPFTLYFLPIWNTGNILFILGN